MKNYFIILILIFPSLLRAQDFSEDYKKAYSETFKVCSNKNFFASNNNLNKEQAKVFFRGLKSFYNPQAMLTLNPETKKLINSDGYWQALADCYPDDEHMWKLFTTNLILADAEGHVAGFALTLVGYELVQGLTETRWALAHPTFVTWATRGATVAGVAVAAKMAADYVKMKRDQHYMKAHPVEALHTEFQVYSDDYNYSVGVLQNRLNEVNDELSNNKIDKHCLQMPADQRAEKCHDYLLERQKSIQYKLAHQ